MQFVDGALDDGASEATSFSVESEFVLLWPTKNWDGSERIRLLLESRFLVYGSIAIDAK